MEIMKDQFKEVIVKGIRKEDHPTVGPKLGIIDREGIWYNTLKRQWTKIPGAWEAMNGLIAGDRAEITYTIRSYTARDGTTKNTNDIIGFNKVIQKEDEANPIGNALYESGDAVSEKPLASSLKFTVPEVGARQTCLNCAAEIVGNWVEKDDSSHVDSVIAVAKELYNSLKEPW